MAPSASCAVRKQSLSARASRWHQCVKAAKDTLGTKKGTARKGTRLYKLARQIYYGESTGSSAKFVKPARTAPSARPAKPARVDRTSAFGKKLATVLPARPAAPKLTLPPKPRAVPAFRTRQPGHMFPRITEAEFYAQYIPQAEMGRGGHGVVYRALEKNTGRMVAVKQMALKNEQDFKQTEQEIAILARLHDKYLVQYFGAYETGPREIAIVMEYIPSVNLRQMDLPDKTKPGFDRVFWAAAADLFSGLWYLHSHHVAHRDIKPENILARPDPQGGIPDFVLVDYGMTCLTKLTDVMKNTPADPAGLGNFRLTQGAVCHGRILGNFFAPEIAKAVQANRRIKSSDWLANDVWGLTLSLLNRFFQPDAGQILLLVELSRNSLPEKAQPTVNQTIQRWTGEGLNPGPMWKFLASGLQCDPNRRGATQAMFATAKDTYLNLAK